MKNNQDSKIDSAILLDMMQAALIEIRASSELNTCKALADIFHNVPNRISNKYPADNILCDMRRVSERNGLRPYLEKLLAHSTKKFSE